MCDRVVEAGGSVIADFICLTPVTRAAFGDAFTIWLDRIEAGRFEDTNRMFAAPEKFDLRVGAEGAPLYWAEQALAQLRPPFDPQKPAALFIGRYQPFHGGHQRLIEDGLRRVGQVCIAVRDTHGIDAKNPLPFFAVKHRGGAWPGCSNPTRRRVRGKGAPIVNSASSTRLIRLSRSAATSFTACNWLTCSSAASRSGASLSAAAWSRCAERFA
jgi:cytidyltransferase-like protein